MLWRAQSAVSALKGLPEVSHMRIAEESEQKRTKVSGSEGSLVGMH